MGRGEREGEGTALPRTGAGTMAWRWRGWGSSPPEGLFLSVLFTAMTVTHLTSHHHNSLLCAPRHHEFENISIAPKRTPVPVSEPPPLVTINLLPFPFSMDRKFQHSKKNVHYLAIGKL